MISYEAVTKIGAQTCVCTPLFIGVTPVGYGNNGI